MNVMQSTVSGEVIFCGDDDEFIIKDMGEVVNEVKELLNKVEDDVLKEELRKMQELSRQKGKASIYKIPEEIREVNPKAFEPQLVSFGPYHYGKPHLVEMELKKQNGYLRFKVNNNLEFESIIVESVSSTLKQLLGSYDNLEDKWKQNPAKFLKLMIVDGCFMLDLIINGFPESLASMIEKIKRDMLLLENQLPFILLQHLYGLVNNNGHKDKGNLSLLIFYWMGMPKGREITGNYLHILDMHRALMLYPSIEKTDDYNSRSRRRYNQTKVECASATRLGKLGIEFKAIITDNLMDVHFNFKTGVLSVPQLKLNKTTLPNLLNMMTFEKFHDQIGSNVISFVVFMTNLIETEDDVLLLITKKILRNELDQDRKVVLQLFNQLFKGPTKCLETNICEVLIMLNKHCKNPWTMWWANLRDPRTQDPWVIISVAAVLFGFLLQIIQTIYGIYGIYRPNH